MFMIKIKNQPLFLHKSSNMFTTDVRQARKYKTDKAAEKWISEMTSPEYNEYRFRFNGLKFIIVEEFHN